MSSQSGYCRTLQLRWCALKVTTLLSRTNTQAITPSNASALWAHYCHVCVDWAGACVQEAARLRDDLQNLRSSVQQTLESDASTSF
jgi:hypothetical protein